MRASVAATRATIEAIWCIEAAPLIGGLVRRVRNVDRAEDLARERSWPRWSIGRLRVLTRGGVGRERAGEELAAGAGGRR